MVTSSEQKSQLNTHSVPFSCLNVKLLCYSASNLSLDFCFLRYIVSQIIINVRSYFLLCTKKGAFDILCCHCGRTVKPLCISCHWSKSSSKTQDPTFHHHLCDSPVLFHLGCLGMKENRGNLVTMWFTDGKHPWGEAEWYFCFLPVLQGSDKWVLKYRVHLLHQLLCSLCYLFFNFLSSWSTNNFISGVLCLSVTNLILQQFVFTIGELRWGMYRQNWFMLLWYWFGALRCLAEIIFLTSTTHEESPSCNLVC